MKALDDLLKEVGIKPHKEDYQQTMDDNFGNPMKQLDDLFESLGGIFGGTFHEDRLRNYKKAEDEKTNPNNKKDN